MTRPTDDPLRKALERIDQLARLVAHDLQGRVEAGKVAAVLQCANVARATLAASPQPAPAPADDERAEMIEVIVQADDAYDRVQGGTWAGAIADALLAAGYRKADALLAERDELIHDIERAKESESALLAELEQARGITRQGSRVNSDWFQRRDHMAPSRHSKKPGSCTFGPSTS